VMCLQIGEEIGLEPHASVDQFFRIESGEGKVIMNGEENAIKDGSAIIVPAGTEHNVINTGSVPLKLYTLYSPPNHKDGIIHVNKAEALADETDIVS
ncbi:MAG: cupin domain-containing protein, partial [Patescibacteria group bacterium]